MLNELNDLLSLYKISQINSLLYCVGRINKQRRKWTSDAVIDLLVHIYGFAGLYFVFVSGENIIEV